MADCPRRLLLMDVCAVFIASGLSIAMQEWRLDFDYTRFALLAATPFLLCISLVCTVASFFCESHGSRAVFRTSNHHEYFICVRSAFGHIQLSPIHLPCPLSIGPVAQYHENSRYYSAIKPAPNAEVDSQLPHVTIELPVYKESLEETM